MPATTKQLDGIARIIALWDCPPSTVRPEAAQINKSGGWVIDGVTIHLTAHELSAAILRADSILDADTA